MRMHVDETGGDNEPLGIDLAPCFACRHSADGDDALAANGDVAEKPRIACAVDDPPITDDEVIHWFVGPERQIADECDNQDQRKATRHWRDTCGQGCGIRVWNSPGSCERCPRQAVDQKLPNPT